MVRDELLRGYSPIVVVRERAGWIWKSKVGVGLSSACATAPIAVARSAIRGGDAALVRGEKAIGAGKCVGSRQFRCNFF
jgi:hypothetical protein